MKPYYSHAGITIYHGDCREVLPHVYHWGDSETCALVTDPPYGISHSSGHGASWSGIEIENDSDTSCRDVVIALFRGCPMAVFGSWKVPRPIESRSVLIWDKGPAFGMGDLSFPWKPSFEEIYIFGQAWEGKRDEGVLRFGSVCSWESGPAHDGNGRCHPTQKPVPLLQHIIGKCLADVIYDPFLGSGTTLIAAKNLGRRAIGIEIEEKYCEIAAKRLSQEVFDFK